MANLGRELRLSRDERAELRRVERSLKSGSWNQHMTVLGELRCWRLLAAEVSGYRDMVEEYTNDLRARDSLEAALPHLSEGLAEKLRPLVQEADAAFLEGTTDDAGRLLARVMRLPPDPPWWWRRIPRSGAMREDLQSRPPRDEM